MSFKEAKRRSLVPEPFPPPLPATPTPPLPRHPPQPILSSVAPDIDSFTGRPNKKNGACLSHFHGHPAERGRGLSGGSVM